ncbi:MAG: ATP-binding protein [Deltaproteobacteria bacterium]|nr:ATP-binding protein [Deltaproteobacteria bacterium]
MEIICGLEDQERFIIEIRDSGVPFDVGAQSDPDLDATIAERKIGGLGIFLVRKMADEMQYKREGEENVLTLLILKPEE